MIYQISENDRLLLKKFRVDYEISDDEHNKIVTDLGWSPDEFELGAKVGEMRSIITEYDEMLAAIFHENLKTVRM